MKTQAIDFTKIIKKHRGKWVALTDDEKKVVAFGISAKETLEKAKKEGFENPILFKVPIAVFPYVGRNSLIK